MEVHSEWRLVAKVATAFLLPLIAKKGLLAAMAAPPSAGVTAPVSAGPGQSTQAV